MCAVSIPIDKVWVYTTYIQCICVNLVSKKAAGCQETSDNLAITLICIIMLLNTNPIESQVNTMIDKMVPATHVPVAYLPQVFIAASVKLLTSIDVHVASTSGQITPSYHKCGAGKVTNTHNTLQANS